MIGDKHTYKHIQYISMLIYKMTVTKKCTLKKFFLIDV